MKIAFCFLVIDKIYHEKMWVDYLQNIPNKEILIHCISNNNLKLMSDINAKIYVNAAEGRHSRLLKIELFLLEQAKLLNADKVIFLSDSCVPIKSSKHVYEFIKKDITYIKWEDMHTEAPQKLPRHLNKYTYLSSHHQWCILDKQYFDLFLYNEDRFEFENDVSFPEESYFASILNKHKFLVSSNVHNVITTYVDWERSVYGPYTFRDASDTNIKMIKSEHQNESSLFFRKVAYDAHAELIDALISQTLI